MHPPSEIPTDRQTDRWTQTETNPDSIGRFFAFTKSANNTTTQQENVSYVIECIAQPYEDITPV